MTTRHDDAGQDLAALAAMLEDLAWDMPPVRQQVLRDHLATEFRQAAAAPSAVPSARPAAGRRRLWVPVTAVAAAGLTAIALIVSGGPAGHGRRPATPPPATVAAVFVLHQAARSAARQKQASNRYLFTESEVYVNLPRLVGENPRMNRSWLSRDVHGPLDRQDGNGHGMPTSALPVLSWSQVRHLPTALRRLRPIIFRLAEVQAAHTGYKSLPRPVAEFRLIADLLFESPAPPRLRAALYDLAATVPGIRLVRGAHDLVGRPATEVYEPGHWQLVPGGGGQALFFSPQTGAVLGWAILTGAKPQCPPISDFAVLATGYVGSAGQVPPGTPGHLLPVTVRRHVPGCAA